MGQEYYLAIDIGATKTLLAIFETGGEMVCEKKLPTSSDYKQFIKDLGDCIKQLDQFKFSYCACAVPGVVDTASGVAKAFGNEDWRDVPIKSDIQLLIPDAKILIHNDAKLAGLSEALLLKNKYRRLLYLTISTGIGGGVIVDNKIDPGFENFEPGQMVFEHGGSNRQWESYASGKALYEKYGKRASDIDDPRIWNDYAKDLVAGFENLIAVVRPEVIVIGGGVGAHFEKFQSYLQEQLSKINNPLVPTPPILKAQRPEEAVIYGCYDYIKQNI